MKAKRVTIMAAVMIMAASLFTGCGDSTPKKLTEEESQKIGAELEEKTNEILEDANAMKKDALKDFVGEMDLEGSWEDEISQRATMDVKKNDDGTYTFLVHWGGGATEAAIWEITGTYDEESGMLSYEDGKYQVVQLDEEEGETILEEDTTKGSFLKEGDKLKWTDSKNDVDGLFSK